MQKCPRCGAPLDGHGSEPVHTAPAPVQRPLTGTHSGSAGTGVRGVTYDRRATKPFLARYQVGKDKHHRYFSTLEEASKWLNENRPTKENKDG